MLNIRTNKSEEKNYHRYSNTHYIKDANLESIEYQISSSWIEIQNGLDVSILIFEATQYTLQKLTSEIQLIISKLKSSPYHWCVDAYCCEFDSKLYLCSFSSISTYKSSKSLLDNNLNIGLVTNEYPTLPTLEKAKILYSLLTLSLSSIEKDTISHLLREEASGNTRVLATLAAEILLAWGEPTLPIQFIYSKNHNHTSQESRPSSSLNQSFEDRIDVGAYNYFELVHPSYARQCVALSHQAIINTDTSAKNIRYLDIGTGPGAALLMQNELMPNTQFLAIEPSDRAYSFLLKNIEQYSHISAEHIDFLHYNTNEKFNIILSTGASHHLNTYSFLQKASELLEENGTFIIADEMISPYKTISQRKLNVMTHHSTYILELLNRLNHIQIDLFEPKEKMLCKLLRDNIPVGYALAKLSREVEAESVYKELLQQLYNLKLDMNISSPFVAFYRLMYLELEALVAGIDYEVEQKTYPEMLIKLASMANLKCVYHECVHNTSGNNAMHSGTHIFTFKHTSQHCS